MLGAKIKCYLEENGIKQSFVAQKTGIKPQIISGICNGTREIKASEYYKICKVLDLPLETFHEM